MLPGSSADARGSVPPSVVGLPTVRRGQRGTHASRSGARLDGMAANESRRWKDLSPRSRATIIAGAAVQFALLGAALADLRRRSPEAVNSPRKLWVAVSFVNFVGPLAYFVLGRRRPQRPIG